MIGDKFLFLEEHLEKAKKILEKFDFQKDKDKTVISISGESGTGKSEIAQLLRSLLFKRKNMKSVIYCLDDYKIRNSKNIGMEQIRWAEIEYGLIKFTCSVPNAPITIYDKFLDSNCTLYFNAKYPSIAIIEGVFALNIKSKYRVLLKGTYKDTEDFRIKRSNITESNYILEKEHEQLEELKNKTKPNLIL
jgi:energy-coupling factor transporter ATP-binding protein EcfA2